MVCEQKISRKSVHLGRHKVIQFSSCGSELALSLAWFSGAQLIVFFCSGISVVLFNSPGISKCHNTLFLSFISLIHYGPNSYLCVFCETFMRTK